ncbi:hypothetical protein GOP47_0025794 [Adiantum capillus-veneris]|uniref:Uncharacterized protein n=1 Tax=Adiantum capillus-veneris TaxID=13818 RepID=A0A9D4U212_ADICA|nr:hypothetical protein GOP47_0025794 [Adiantum capillus-veneris]
MPSKNAENRVDNVRLVESRSALNANVDGELSMPRPPPAVGQEPPMLRTEIESVSMRTNELSMSGAE